MNAREAPVGDCARARSDAKTSTRCFAGALTADLPMRDVLRSPHFISPKFPDRLPKSSVPHPGRQGPASQEDRVPPTPLKRYKYIATPLVKLTRVIRGQPLHRCDASGSIKVQGSRKGKDRCRLNIIAIGSREWISTSGWIYTCTCTIRTKTVPSLASIEKDQRREPRGHASIGTVRRRGQKETHPSSALEWGASLRSS